MIISQKIPSPFTPDKKFFQLHLLLPLFDEIF